MQSLPFGITQAAFTVPVSGSLIGDLKTGELVADPLDGNRGGN